MTRGLAPVPDQEAAVDQDHVVEAPQRTLQYAEIVMTIHGQGLDPNLNPNLGLDPGLGPKKITFAKQPKKKEISGI